MAQSSWAAARGSGGRRSSGRFFSSHGRPMIASMVGLSHAMFPHPSSSCSRDWLTADTSIRRFQNTALSTKLLNMSLIIGHGSFVLTMSAVVNLHLLRACRHGCWTARRPPQSIRPWLATVPHFRKKLGSVGLEKHLARHLPVSLGIPGSAGHGGPLSERRLLPLFVGFNLSGVFTAFGFLAAMSLVPRHRPPGQACMARLAPPRIAGSPVCGSSGCRFVIPPYCGRNCSVGLGWMPPH